MRFSTVSVALFVGAVAAVPQYPSVQPISQISDGQIQAPPATSVPVPPVKPSSPVVTPSVKPSSPVVTYPASLPAPPTTQPPAPYPTAPAANSTVIIVPSSRAPSSAPVPSRASSSAGVPQQSGNAAAENAVSLGGLAVAIAAAMLV